MIKLFTIGFANKSAEAFFNLLQSNKVKKIVDIRINNLSQLAGFSKEPDLKFFSKTIANIEYEHNIDFAPTKELLFDYRNKKISWDQYEKKYLRLIEIRKIIQKTKIEELHQSCFLCSEHAPDKCHRRILAEYLKSFRKDIEIIHLI